MLPFPYKLYLVTDEQACLGRDFFTMVEQAVKGGVDLVQIREKHLDPEAFLQKAIRLTELLDRYGVPLIVNDNVSIALQTGAAGIHVGNNDMQPLQVREQLPAGIIGYSIEYEEQLYNPHTAIADYLGLSPVFTTPTKRDTVTQWGLEGIRNIRRLTDKPLVAIGNINKLNAGSVIRAGADCLAVVSAICSAPQPAKAAELLRNEIEKAS